MTIFTAQGGTDTNKGTSTYGTLTNVQILALASPTGGQTAYSIDDNIHYTFFGSTWHSTGGGILT